MLAADQERWLCSMRDSADATGAGEGSSCLQACYCVFLILMPDHDSIGLDSFPPILEPQLTILAPNSCRVARFGSSPPMTASRSQTSPTSSPSAQPSAHARRAAPIFCNTMTHTYQLPIPSRQPGPALPP